MNDIISVIVPVYNTAQHLSHSFDTLTSQTYKNTQIIATDDGSWDTSGAILDEIIMQDGRAMVIHKRNAGVTLARLDAARIANGQYIGFMDSDDEIEPEMYERLLKNMKKYNAQISHCGYQVHCLDGSVQHFYNTGRLAKQDRSEALKALLAGSIEPGLWNKLYNKTLFHSLLHNGVIDSQIRYFEDLLFNYFLFKEANRSVFQDVCLYHYMKREDSASNLFIQKGGIWDPIKVKKIIFKDCQTGELNNDAAASLLDMYVNIYNCTLQEKKTEWKNERSLIRNEIRNMWGYFSVLSPRTKLLIFTIIKIPFLYEWIYSYYFQRLRRKVMI